MTDPYKILGVSPNATDDEVKKAYRALARKYHPDKYRDSDLADLAAEKMKEVNAAYDEIQKMRESQRKGGAQGGYQDTYGTGGYNGSGSYSRNPRYNEIRRLINTGNGARAEHLLWEVPEQERNAEWNFLMGCILVQRRRYVDAQRYFDIACSMDPYNDEYRAGQEELRRRSNAYGGGYQTNQSGGCSGCDICQCLICSDCCCECMGGDLIACC